MRGVFVCIDCLVLTFHSAEFVQEQQKLALHARERQLHQTIGVDVDQMRARVGGRFVLFLLQRVGAGRGRRRGRLVRAHREAEESGVTVLLDRGTVVDHNGRRFRGFSGCGGGIGGLRVRRDRGRGIRRVRQDHVGGRAPRRQQYTHRHGGGQHHIVLCR